MTLRYIILSYHFYHRFCGRRIGVAGYNFIRPNRDQLLLTIGTRAASN